MPLSKIDSDSLNTPITAVDLAYTGTLTGGTGIVNLGSGQVYKDASGNVGVGTSSPVAKLDVRGILAIANSAASYWALDRNDSDGALTFADGTTERARIDTSGNLLVGTTSALGKITSSSGFDTGAGWDTTAALSTKGSFGGGLVMVDGSGGYGLYCADNGNDFYIQGSNSLSSALTGGVYLNDRATSWSSASDERLKTIIEPITDAVSKVCQLRTVIGRYNYEPEGKRHPFLIAQDVQAVLPEAVSVADKKSEEQYLGVSYTDTIPLLVAAIKELKAIVDAQGAEIAALKGTP